MGKTSRFFKALFSIKPSDSPHLSHDADKQTKRRWSFFKSDRDKPRQHLPDVSVTRSRDTPRHHRYSDQTDGCSTNNHAIAVAAANVADAAVAAVHAAAEVVRMTSRATVVGGSDYGISGEWAAVKIQSNYRAYLARKALRALKSLVMLQALVRGQLVRKEAANGLRRLQDLVRTQARVRECWLRMTESPQSTTKGPPTPEKFEHINRSRVIKHNQPSILKANLMQNNDAKLYDERTEKVLEIDATKFHLRRRNLFQSDQISYRQSQSLTTSRGSTFHSLGLSPNGSREVTSLTGPLTYIPHDIDEQVSLCNTQNSPSFYAYSSKNGSMRGGPGPFTPATAKSDSSRSCLSGYSDHPNYMAYTESSRAKVRSVSAPRQRPNVEFTSTTKRYSVYGYGSGAQRGSNLRDSFVSKAYPGSGRLDRLGMPVGGMGFRESEFSGGYWN